MFVGREPTSQSHKHMLSGAATPFWNNAVWLVKTSPVTFVSQSECFISEQRSYASLNIVYGIGSWSSDNGRRLMSWRSWVRIPAPFTEWTFFTFICCKNRYICLKRRNNRKRFRGWPIEKRNMFCCHFISSNSSLLYLPLCIKIF